MIDPHHVPPVDDTELLTRFILRSNELRADGTVKPKLFLPYQFVELSVNRHREATSAETWAVGWSIGIDRGTTLYGRADIRASACRITPLDIIPTPRLPQNPNHANVVGVPARQAGSTFAGDKAGG